MDNRSYLDGNDRERARLAALADRLTDDQLARLLDGGWTVAALLAHVAFWDRFVLARWQRALAEGTTVASLDEPIQELINTAAVADWLAVPSRAARQAVEAAEALDRTIAALPPTVVAEIRARGLPRLLDRSIHRREHLDAIEAALRR